jgi:hypothetical protein
MDYMMRRNSKPKITRKPIDMENKRVFMVSAGGESEADVNFRKYVKNYSDNNNNLAISNSIKELVNMAGLILEMDYVIERGKLFKKIYLEDKTGKLYK